MKRTYQLSLALAIAALAGTAWATVADTHQGHHPATAVPEAATAAPAPPANTSGPDMGRMEAQMAAMRAMHDKMMAAKTPEARNALMAEHMKVMQDSMDMMGAMSAGGMNMMGGMPQGGGMDGMKCDMSSRHQGMEERMQMMQSMMQMMMDRLPEAPTK
jgi:hypothetical protein